MSGSHAYSVQSRPESLAGNRSILREQACRYPPLRDRRFAVHRASAPPPRHTAGAADIRLCGAHISRYRAAAGELPGVEIELSTVLHASEEATVPGPLPPNRECEEPVASSRSGTKVRRRWPSPRHRRSGPTVPPYRPSGGRSSPARRGFRWRAWTSTTVALPPKRAPDAEVSLPILPQQAC